MMALVLLYKFWRIENKNISLDATIIPDSSEIICTSEFDIELVFVKN